MTFATFVLASSSSSPAVRNPSNERVSCLQGRRQHGAAQIGRPGCSGRRGAHIDGGGAAEVSRQQISGDFGARQK